MQFYYDSARKRIVSEDPEVWVEDCGTMRERGHGFILHLRGKKIGFEEVSTSSERIKGPTESSISWTIDKIGGSVDKWSSKLDCVVEAAHGYHFECMGEQVEAVELIEKSLSVFLDIFGKYDVENVSVFFTDRLRRQLASGELIREVPEPKPPSMWKRLHRALLSSERQTK